MKVLILYATFSGNTEEVAEIIYEELYGIGCEVLKTKTVPENHAEYDVIMLGTFSWGRGRVPDVTKKIVADLAYKPEHIAIFGTGDSQFGKYYGKAIERLAEFYDTKYPTLVIEQSPGGIQIDKIRKWTREVLRIADEFNQES